MNYQNKRENNLPDNKVVYKYLFFALVYFKPCFKTALFRHQWIEVHLQPKCNNKNKSNIFPLSLKMLQLEDGYRNGTKYPAALLQKLVQVQINTWKCFVFKLKGVLK